MLRSTEFNQGYPGHDLTSSKYDVTVEKLTGTGYRQIRDQLLAELAVRHLRESGLSVEATAALLGYHDAANFRRAFKRWLGRTPRDFRRRYPSSWGVYQIGEV